MEYDVGSGLGPGTGGAGAGLPQPGEETVKSKFAGKTSAQIVTPGELAAIKAHLGLHVVGVTGFSGQWSQEKIDANPALGALVQEATLMFKLKLLELDRQYGKSLIISSGATMEGVPKIVYDACESLGISAMGVTSEKAADYKLGKMDLLVVEGKDWGDESPTFIDSSDEILMLGGGGQAKREAIAAATEGKPVTIFQGYGGSADQLTPSDVPNADFIARH